MWSHCFIFLYSEIFSATHAQVSFLIRQQDPGSEFSFLLDTDIRCKWAIMCLCSFRGLPFFSFSHYSLSVFCAILSFIHSFSCYHCLDEITAVRKVKRDCVASLNASLSASSSPLWGVHRPQLAAQNSPFSWREEGRKKNHPELINPSATSSLNASRVG